LSHGTWPPDSTLPQGWSTLCCNCSLSKKVSLHQFVLILITLTWLCSGNVVKSGRLLETSSWICNTPSHSPTETKLRELLVELGRKQRVLGVQVWLGVFFQIELSQRVWVKMVNLKR